MALFPAQVQLRRLRKRRTQKKKAENSAFFFCVVCHFQKVFRMTDKQKYIKQSAVGGLKNAAWAAALAALLWQGHALATSPAPAVSHKPLALETVLLRGPAGQITLAEVQALAAISVPPEQRAAVLGSRSSLEQLALAAYTQKALAAQARAAGYDKNEQAQHAERLAAVRALSDSWMAHQSELQKPADAQLEKLARSMFANDKASFAEGPRVHVRHLLVRPGEGRTDEQAQAHAEALLARLKAGESMEKLAREESADKGSAARGGELPPFGRGRMAPEFEQAAFLLQKPGELAGPVKTDFGYHLIELIERLPAAEPVFEDYRDRLIEGLRIRRQQQIREELWREAQKDVQYEQAAIDAAVGGQPAVPLKSAPPAAPAPAAK